MGVSEQVGCIEKIGDGLMESTGRNEIDVRRVPGAEPPPWSHRFGEQHPCIPRPSHSRVGVGNVRGETLKLVARKNIPTDFATRSRQESASRRRHGARGPNSQKAGGVPMIAPNSF